MIHFDGQEQLGLVIIEWQSTDVLVGMDFLRKFKKQLAVDPINGKVELTDALGVSTPPLPPTPQQTP